MPAIELKVRNLTSGDIMLAEIPSIDEALKWLEERPHGIDVLGVVTEDLPLEIHEALRNAMRPLDDEERALDDQLQAARIAQMEAVIEAENRRQEEKVEAYIESQKSADPGRPMVLHFERDEGWSKSDPHDPRDIPEAVSGDLAAWIAERNTWVKKKGLEIHSADVTIWPQDVPEGWDGVVHPGGTFSPGLRKGAEDPA